MHLANKETCTKKKIQPLIKQEGLKNEDKTSDVLMMFWSRQEEEEIN